jgi:hypothetical protein
VAQEERNLKSSIEAVWPIVLRGELMLNWLWDYYSHYLLRGKHLPNLGHNWLRLFSPYRKFAYFYNKLHVESCCHS